MTGIMTLPTEDPIPTRYSLLSRLQDWDDQDSWKDFFDTYWRLIYSVAMKSGLSEAEAQDVVQETVICVAKDLPKFKKDRSLGSFKGWLRNITHWRIGDQLRKRAQATELANAIRWEEVRSEAAELHNPTAELESVWEEEWRANLLEAALDRVKTRVKEEHYQIFDLYVLKHWPVKKVAETLGVNIGQIYLAKHRVSLLIKKEIRLLERQWD